MLGSGFYINLTRHSPPQRLFSRWRRKRRHEKREGAPLFLSWQDSACTLKGKLLSRKIGVNHTLGTRAKIFFHESEFLALAPTWTKYKWLFLWKYTYSRIIQKQSSSHDDVCSQFHFVRNWMEHADLSHSNMLIYPIDKSSKCATYVHVVTPAPNFVPKLTWIIQGTRANKKDKKMKRKKKERQRSFSLLFSPPTNNRLRSWQTGEG